MKYLLALLFLTGCGVICNEKHYPPKKCVNGLVYENESQYSIGFVCSGGYTGNFYSKTEKQCIEGE